MASYQIPAADPVRLTLLDGGIAYGAATTPGGSPTVEVLRHGDKEPTTIFTGAPGALVDMMVADRDYLSWSVDAFTQQDPTQPVPWRIYAYNLRTGNLRVVASSPKGSKGSPLPAAPVVSGDRVAWAVYRGLRSKGSDVYVADLGTGVTRRVLSNVHTGQILLTGDSLIYNDTVRMPTSASDPGVSDLFELDLGSSATRRLTHDGEVDWPVIWGRWLAWESGSWDPGRKLGSLRLPDGPVLSLKDQLQGLVDVGAGFAVYDAIGGLDATALAPGAKPVRIASDARESCAVCGFSVRGNRVAWGATHRGMTTVTVDVISLSSPGTVGGAAPSASEPTTPGGP